MKEGPEGKSKKKEQQRKKRVADGFFRGEADISTN